MYPYDTCCFIALHSRYQWETICIQLKKKMLSNLFQRAVNRNFPERMIMSMCLIEANQSQGQRAGKPKLSHRSSETRAQPQSKTGGARGRARRVRSRERQGSHLGSASWSASTPSEQMERPRTMRLLLRPFQRHAAPCTRANAPHVYKWHRHTSKRSATAAIATARAQEQRAHLLPTEPVDHWQQRERRQMIAPRIGVDLRREAEAAHSLCICKRIRARVATVQSVWPSLPDIGDAALCTDARGAGPQLN